MTHIDTFDPKPGTPEQGETKAIATKTAGIQLGDNLPKLAQLTDAMAIVRSIFTTTADHQQATYLLQTNYRQIASIVHPAMGAFANASLGAEKDAARLRRRRPGRTSSGAGYLDPKFTPIPVGDPELGLQNTTRPKYLNDQLFEERLDLIKKFGGSFRRKYPLKQVDAYAEFYRQAVELMSSEDLKAFDLSQEKDSVRDDYGRTPFGQGALLARRLVEHDVRWSEVSFGNWDMHDDIYGDNALPSKAGELDQTMSALLRDLQSRGLLKTTLVVLISEFGRSPKINERGGRDHHPGVFSGVLAGGGIKGGLTYGKSDDRGFRPAEHGVDISDFNATIAAAPGAAAGQGAGRQKRPSVQIRQRRKADFRPFRVIAETHASRSADRSAGKNPFCLSPAREAAILKGGSSRSRRRRLLRTAGTVHDDARVYTDTAPSRRSRRSAARTADLPTTGRDEPDRVDRRAGADRIVAYRLRLGRHRHPRDRGVARRRRDRLFSIDRERFRNPARDRHPTNARRLVSADDIAAGANDRCSAAVHDIDRRVARRVATGRTVKHRPETLHSARAGDSGRERDDRGETGE
ncbi:MAG: DUF1501 domain-containing protein [Pirellulales bacterium]